MAPHSHSIQGDSCPLLSSWPSKHKEHKGERAQSSESPFLNHFERNQQSLPEGLSLCPALETWVLKNCRVAPETCHPGSCWRQIPTGLGCGVPGRSKGLYQVAQSGRVQRYLQKLSNFTTHLLFGFSLMLMPFLHVCLQRAGSRGQGCGQHQLYS